MEAVGSGAEPVSIIKCQQFHVCLERSRQAATTRSDADRQEAIEQLDHEIHQVTPAKQKIFNKYFQYHKRQLLHQVGNRATGNRTKFTKELTLMKTAAKGDG
jgi:hypothetical protein